MRFQALTLKIFHKWYKQEREQVMRKLVYLYPTEKAHPAEMELIKNMTPPTVR